MTKNRREVILDEVEDLVSHLLYYDRKEDPVLGEDDIREAVKNGEISALEIATKFTRELHKGLFGK